MRQKMLQILKHLWRAQIGQDMIEYALLLMLVALGTVSSSKSLSSTIKNTYSGIGSTITAQTAGGTGNTGNSGNTGNTNNIGNNNNFGNNNNNFGNNNNNNNFGNNNKNNNNGKNNNGRNN